MEIGSAHPRVLRIRGGGPGNSPHTHLMAIHDLYMLGTVNVPTGDANRTNWTEPLL